MKNFLFNKINMEKSKSRKRNKRRNSNERQENTLHNYFTPNKVEASHLDANTESNRNASCPITSDIESIKKLNKPELTLREKNDTQNTHSGQIRMKLFDGTQLVLPNEIVQHSAENARSPRKKFESCPENKKEVDGTTPDKRNGKDKTQNRHQHKNLKRDRGVFGDDKNQESPILFKDDEVEIQFQSPRKSKPHELKEQIEHWTSNAPEEVVTDNEILYKDEEVEVQFQSPKKFKKQEPYREIRIVQSGTSTGIDHTLSFGKKWSKPTMENKVTKASHPVIKETVLEDMSPQSQKRIRGTSFKKAIYALCFEKFREHNRDKKLEKRAENEVGLVTIKMSHLYKKCQKFN